MSKYPEIEKRWFSCVEFLTSMTREESEDVLNGLYEKYNEKHRYWHTLKHINDMLFGLNKYRDLICSDLKMHMIELAIFFHDFIYVPYKKDNEEESVYYFKKMICNKIKPLFGNNIELVISDAILQTKQLSVPLFENNSNIVAHILWRLDTEILFSKDIFELLEYEDAIFKEYQYLQYHFYKEKRCEFLLDVEANFREIFQNKMISQLREHIQHKKPRIGLYVGSFNPFHVGHNNILEKAEKIFDKVVIGVGVNPDKSNRSDEFYGFLPKHKEIVHYSGLVTELIETLEVDCDVTVIMGLRDSSDLIYVQNYIRTVTDLKKDVKFVILQSDVEFQHVSSSMIRGLMKFDKNSVSKYLK